MDPSHSTTSHSHGHHHNPNSSDLMASAKIVAEAAKSTFNHESEKIDRARVAGAASDILDAACHYGKLEEKSFGKYVEKAEDYLHKYGSSHPSAAAATAGGGHHPAQQHAGAPAAAAAAPHHSSAHSGGEEHSGSGGYGDYLKMAQGLLNSGGEEHSGSGGGYGDYVKMAQGFLKK